METIILEDMDKLLSPTEQAKMIGILKEPERLQKNEKQNYILYGMAISCFLLISCFFIQHIIENNKQQKKKMLS